jgi:regulatory protein YycH of two-component signal transduction system YycFG
MKEKAKSVKICCNECKHEFSLNSVNIQKAIISINGQVLKLVYFACQKCNKIYRISLEDEAYEELKDDLENTKERMRKAYNSGKKEFASTLNQMVLKKYNRLKNHLKNLDKKYPGTFTFVASENNHEDKIIKYLP